MPSSGERLNDALSPDASVGPAAVPVPRTKLRRDYQVAAAPLRKRFRQFIGTREPVAVALITDPERQIPASKTSDPDYKLTPKEAMLAAKLSEGRSVEHAARNCHYL